MRSANVHNAPTARLRGTVAVLAALASVALASYSTAATFTVDSTADEVDANPGDGICATAMGFCSLRAAFAECSGCEIDVPAGFYYLGSNGALSTTAYVNVVVVGAGPAETIIDGGGFQFNVSANGAAIAGVTIQHSPGPAITFSGASLVVENTVISENTGGGISCSNYGSIMIGDSLISGNSAPSGGGIRVGSDANLSITRTVVRDNLATGSGGGISASLGAYVQISESTISNNSAADFGGGIATDGSLFIMSSTLSGNTGETGGGISLRELGSLTLENSTIAENAARGHGGGVYVEQSVFGPSTARHATIVGNHADSDADGVGDGGGVYLRQDSGSPAAMQFQGTLLALNDDSGGEAPDCSAASLTSNGHNLVGSLLGCTLIGDLTGNITGVAPGLASLGDYGGSTETYALSPGSPAIDAADSADCPITDQRGVSRPQGAACDIGAYEFACGNGTVDLGETCDDGNTVDGDCCSADCQLEPTGSPCNDGNACTNGDTCDSGSCVPGPALDCGACENCDQASGCVAHVLTGCHEPTERFSGELLLQNKATPKLKWQWAKGEATTLLDFGNPFVGDRLSLCLFDESAATPHVAFRATTRVGLCSGAPCWRTAGAGSFKYKDRDQTPDGLESLLLKSGADGKAKVQVAGRGPNLAVPTMPLGLPARMQLQAENGQCWESRYVELGTSRNDATEFKAKAFQP